MCLLFRSLDVLLSLTGKPLKLGNELISLLLPRGDSAVFFMETLQEGFEILRGAIVKEVFARAPEQQQVLHAGCSGEQNIERAPQRIPVCVHVAHISDDAATKRLSL